MDRSPLLQIGFYFLTALLLAPVQGDDWPQWRGPLRTGHASSEARPLDTLPTEPKVIWQLRIGEGFASPVVAASNVLYFDNQSSKETLHLVRASDGGEIWRAEVDPVFTDEQGPAGPRCTPVIDHDLLFAQSGKGELQCRAFVDGHLLWHINFLHDFGAAFLGEDSKVPGAAEHGYTASPLVMDDKLIACVGGTNGAGVVCFQKRTGKIVWQSQDDLAAYAAPISAVLGGVPQIVCFTVEGLIGLAPEDGKLLWRYPLKTNYGRNTATPVVVGDLVITGSYRAGLLALKISREGDSWKVDRAWLNKSLGINFSSPISVGREIYGLGPSKNIFCVDADTGKLNWSKEGYISSSGDVAYAAFLAIKDRLLVCTDGGEAILIASNPSECRQVARSQVCGLNWSNPAYANGRLFIRDGIKGTGSNLYCIELLP